MGYSPPSITPSGITFTQLQASGLSGHLEKLITANSAATPNPSAAGTLSANAGGTVGGLLSPGVYYANFTEGDGLGETAVGVESGPITVAVQTPPTGTPTVVVSGTGGTLTNGVYFGKFTYVDSNLNAAGVHGETTGGTEFTFTQTTGAQPVITIADGGLPAWASGRNLYLTAPAGASGTEVLAFTAITGTTYTVAANPATSAVTVPATNTTSTNIPKFTAFPALQAGNTVRNIYLTAPGGATGSEMLFARDVATTTFTFSTANISNSYGALPPAANTTAYGVADYSLLRAGKHGQLQYAYGQLDRLIYEFDRGSHVPHAQTLANLKRLNNLFSVFGQLLTEVGVLLDANPGHLVPTTDGIGVGAVKRIWP